MKAKDNPIPIDLVNEAKEIINAVNNQPSDFTSSLFMKINEA